MLKYTRVSKHLVATAKVGPPTKQDLGEFKPFLQAVRRKPNALIHPFGQPAVHKERLPGDVGRPLRRQKHGSRGDFVRVSKAARGDVGLEPPPRLPAEHLLGVRRRGVAGSHVVDRHTVPRDLARERFCVLRHRRAKGVRER